MADPDEYVFYRDRPEWKDVEPVPQDDGPYPVVQIAYSDKFKDCYDYFRAILKRDERSERAFQLTADAIELNPANYTVWHYRRILLSDLGKDLNEELQYLNEVILETPKNYQVWHHRQVVIDRLNNPADLLEFTAKVLADDPKNYHAWQHRQWGLQRFSLWDQELDFVNTLLHLDLRNNSAWNQRYFVVSETTGFTDDVIKQELLYTIPFINRAPNNESSWNYLQGVMNTRNLRDFPNVKELCEKMLSEHKRSPYLLSLLVDIFEDEATAGETASIDRAIETCNSLATEDTIRCNYWNYRLRRLEALRHPAASAQ